MYKIIHLSGECFADLNTEIRFAVAEARSEATEILRLTPGNTDTRAINCMIRVLRAMSKDGLIQFFVPTAQMADGSTEAEFLINKYSAHIASDEWAGADYYVKL